MKSDPSDPFEVMVLECPCCGDDGAVSDADNLFADGQGLICGCAGHVSVDSETDAWISMSDLVCLPGAKCHDD